MRQSSWLSTLLALCSLLPPLTAAAQAPKLLSLAGEWIYVEDRTEGRPVEQHQPSMASKFGLRVEADAVTLVRRNEEVRMALDGSPTELTRDGRISRYRGRWQDGAFTYEIEMLPAADQPPTGLLRFELTPTAEGVLARVEVNPPTGMKSLALYRQAKDIAMPTPKPAKIDELQWLAGAWVGTRGSAGTTTIEERWSPPRGGAMLAVSRTVARERMSAFEFLRIVERDGGLVYFAQPGGRTATEFVLTELDGQRAVFENPRHDSPQRIVYELSSDGKLSASIGFAKGGKPQRFEFGREDG